MVVIDLGRGFFFFSFSWWWQDRRLSLTSPGRIVFSTESFGGRAMGGNEEDEVEDENDDDDITFSSSVALSDILYFLVVDIYAEKKSEWLLHLL